MSEGEDSEVFVGGRYHHRRIIHDLTHEIVISVKRIKLIT